MLYLSGMARPKKRRWSNRAIALTVLFFAVAAAGYLTYRHYHHSSTTGNTPQSSAITKAGNIPQSTSPSSTTTPQTQPKNPKNNTQNAPGGSVDTGGKTAATTNSSQWVTSKSGVITVEQPVANATLQNGDYLIGTAKVGTISFRLSDTSVGQIAAGNMQVVNGKFSGKLGFTAHSSAGELDVFSTNSKGVELNEIQIAVRF